MKTKILFLKSRAPQLLPTETFALKILNDSKYDNHPLINKDAIEEAFKEYGEKLNPLNTKILPTIDDYNFNIEGNFIAQNIPEIPSVVINKICTKNVLYETLDKYDDITHIGLSAYAMGLDNTIEIIKTIQNDFPHIELLIGGVGASYQHIQELVSSKNICREEGVNFLRKKFNLKLLSSKEFKIPKIIAKITEFPLPINAAYMVSQIGCPNNCNFCPSPYIYRYKPFSNAAKIINYLEKLSNNSNKDIFLYICDPNAFYPFQIWQKVFDYFIKNPKKIDYNIFIFCLSSLNHLNKFNLEKIQKSPLSILFINYGIESAINKYPKNRGNPKKVVERLNNLNIITYQSFIIGFPFHTPELLKLDVMKNLEFNSDIFFINAYKPLPMTPLYNQLKSEERIFGMELPPEFLWVFEYMAFKHPFLGFGFDILKYCFYSYVESEKKTIDIYGKISDKLLNIFAHTNSRKIKRAASIFSKMSQANFFSFQNRMPINLTKIYKKRIEKNIKKIH